MSLCWSISHTWSMGLRTVDCSGHGKPKYSPPLFSCIRLAPCKDEHCSAYTKVLELRHRQMEAQRVHWFMLLWIQTSFLLRCSNTLFRTINGSFFVIMNLFPRSNAGKLINKQEWRPTSWNLFCTIWPKMATPWTLWRSAWSWRTVVELASKTTKRS